MPQDSPIDARAIELVPQPLRWSAWIVIAEAAALGCGAVALAIQAIIGHPTRRWAALVIVAFMLLGGVVLIACARGLLSLLPSSRTPIVMVQLLALPVAFSLGFQAGRLLIAGPILLAAIAVLIGLFTPSARQALDHPPLN